MHIFLLFIFFQSLLAANNCTENRLLICGVCRNVSGAIDNTIKSIEDLGSHFSDYTVIIYENNSSDDTAEKLTSWAKTNPKVVLLHETLSTKKLNLSRTTRIAKARNKVLAEARKKKYSSYKYLVMADLDFRHHWPTQEITQSINQAFDWDCISANGITESGMYYDRFAYRSREFPFGPELLDGDFWADLGPNDQGTWFTLTQNGWPQVYSAFGGLAIYKTATITQFTYSGTATKQLKKYYQNILSRTPSDTPHLIKYKNLNAKKAKDIIFRKNCLAWQLPKDKSIAVCEHVTLHAAMALKGHGIFYINPKLIMRY